ncbi:MAG: nitroreductase family deazaflavin-dependent oxidoreductase [Acidimicrobiia bacterium]|nr:nitroreductase family deazaflavin-dependent oxidoreductase [Acidimicrobiia bacterium]
MDPELRDALAIRSVVDLTTFGRITGRPHRIEIWFAFHESTLFMLSGGGTHSDWVKNIIADPAVILHVDDLEVAANARLIRAIDEADLARHLVFEKYNPGYAGDLTEWRMRSVPIAVEPAM